MCKKPRGNNIICRLLQSLWLHTQTEDGANTSRQRPTQINRRSQMILYRNTKAKICSSYGDTDYFDIVAGELQGDT